jgi:hypothetical protein
VSPPAPRHDLAKAKPAPLTGRRTRLGEGEALAPKWPDASLAAHGHDIVRKGKPVIMASAQLNPQTQPSNTIFNLKSLNHSFLKKSEFEKRMLNLQLPTHSFLEKNKKNLFLLKILCQPARRSPVLNIRSSKKTKRIFFYSKSYVNSARLTNQQSPIIKNHPRSSAYPINLPTFNWSPIA